MELLGLAWADIKCHPWEVPSHLSLCCSTSAWGGPSMGSHVPIPEAQSLLRCVPPPQHHPFAMVSWGSGSLPKLHQFPMTLPHHPIPSPQSYSFPMNLSFLHDPPFLSIPSLPQDTILSVSHPFSTILSLPCAPIPSPGSNAFPVPLFLPHTPTTSPESHSFPVTPSHPFPVVPSYPFPFLTIPFPVPPSLPQHLLPIPHTLIPVKSRNTDSFSLFFFSLCFWVCSGWFFFCFGFSSSIKTPSLPMPGGAAPGHAGPAAPSPRCHRVGDSGKGTGRG